MPSSRQCSRCGTLWPYTLEYFYSRGRVCRQCQRRYAAEYRKANPEKVKAATKRWREQNREHVLAYLRQWHAEHPGENSKRRDYKKEWSARNRAALSEYYKAYKKQHADKVAESCRKRYARKRASDGDLSTEDVDAQRLRQKGRCFYCGAPLAGGRAEHVDHVVPLALGGEHVASNIVVACAPCNCSKGAKHPMDFAGILF